MNLCYHFSMEKEPQMYNTPETRTEHIPTKEEIMSLILQRCENFIHTQELSDEQGMYLFEVKSETKEGEFTEYVYQRKGKFGRYQAAQTVLEAIYYKDDIPIGGDIIAELNSESGEWQWKII